MKAIILTLGLTWLVGCTTPVDALDEMTEAEYNATLIDAQLLASATTLLLVKSGHLDPADLNAVADAVAWIASAEYDASPLIQGFIAGTLRERGWTDPEVQAAALLLERWLVVRGFNFIGNQDVGFQVSERSRGWLLAVAAGIRPVVSPMNTDEAKRVTGAAEAEVAAQEVAES